MTDDRNGKRTPYVRIIEQPMGKGVRFRYECEGRSAGCLIGENTTIYDKTYPTIKIENYKGPAFVVVSCVSKDPPFYPHPHNLVGRTKEVSNGICYFKTESEDMVVRFTHLGVQCVTRKGIENSLAIRQKLRVDPFNVGFDQDPEKIDLYCIRLCFQVFLEGHVKGNFDVALNPILSAQIYDKRMRVEPIINFISLKSASAAGGTEICILCEKVIKDDVEVRFYRKENKWEAIAELTPPKVFKQVAVVFRSPKYVDQHINEPVKVKVQLRRISDGAASDSISFIMVPAHLYKRCGFNTNSGKKILNLSTSIGAQPKPAKRKRSFGLTIADQIQAEISKNTDLIKLAYSKSQNTQKSEVWELTPMENKSVTSVPSTKNKSATPANKAKPFIPVITIRNNEFKEMRMKPLKLTSLHSGYSKNIQSKPFDYSMKSSTSQKSQNSRVYYQPLNIVSLQTCRHSSETIKSDSWINNFIETIDENNLDSSPSVLPTASKNIDCNILTEPEARFVNFDTIVQENFADVHEIDKLLGLYHETDENIVDLTPISSSLSSLNIKDIGSGAAGTNMGNIFRSIDNLPPVTKAQNRNEPLEIAIEALKDPYLL